jgi:hypothetical protein
VPLTSLPNMLTLSRILAIPVVVATFYMSGDYARWFGCALFAAAGFTDWLDGHMARRWEQQSELGRFLDPIADKLLVSATLLMLTATGRLAGLVVLPALVILCREILVSGLREYLAGTVGRPAGVAAREMEDDDPDDRDRLPDRRRRRAAPHPGRMDRRDAAVARGDPDHRHRLRLPPREPVASDPAAPPPQSGAQPVTGGLACGTRPHAPTD